MSGIEGLRQLEKGLAIEDPFEAGHSTSFDQKQHLQT